MLAIQLTRRRSRKWSPSKFPLWQRWQLRIPPSHSSTAQTPPSLAWILKHLAYQKCTFNLGIEKYSNKPNKGYCALYIFGPQLAELFVKDWEVQPCWRRMWSFISWHHSHSASWLWIKMQVLSLGFNTMSACLPAAVLPAMMLMPLKHKPQ